MKRVVVPLAPGFEEIEAITVIDILRRAGVEVMVAGIVEGAIEGRCGIKVIPDGSIDRVKAADFEMIILPGGAGGTEHLKKDPRVLQLLKEMQNSGKYTSAICAAPTVLSAAGMITGKKITSHPTVKNSLTESSYSENRVVIDGNLVTSRAPGTAMEFAFTLVELLVGKKKANEVNQGVMAKI
ncbi:MAG TPA: DJ-1 family glyoxalase III [Nitrospiria bacterium]|jgi:4-methyl-5(b-hydroxyethyl)-thiazole monophosphate biosynthesis